MESETTDATLGKQGVRKFNIMANLDFLSIPIGEYIINYINFAKDLKKPSLIFGVNYFLKDKNGNYLSGMQDKRVWLKWMELRVHNEVKIIKTPLGFFPMYEDLKKLFKEVLNSDYDEKDYSSQFSMRIPENLAKIERIVEIYKTKVPDTPDVVFEVLDEQKARLHETKIRYGNYVTPDIFEKSA